MKCYSFTKIGTTSKIVFFSLSPLSLYQINPMESDKVCKFKTSNENNISKFSILNNIKDNNIFKKIINQLTEDRILELFQKNKNLQNKKGLKIIDYRNFFRRYETYNVELTFNFYEKKDYFNHNMEYIISMLNKKYCLLECNVPIEDPFDKETQRYIVCYEEKKNDIDMTIKVSFKSLIPEAIERKNRNGLKQYKLTDLQFILSYLKNTNPGAKIGIKVDFYGKKPIYCKKMFEGFSNCVKIDLSEFNTSKVTDMSYMFKECSSLEELNLKNFNTNNVTNLHSMFENCSLLTDLDLSSFHTKNVNNMRAMFSGCCVLKNLVISEFDTSNVIIMKSMFYGCKALKKLNLNNMDTSKVTDMSYMFEECSSLEELNLSSFNTKKVLFMKDMFSGCKSLTSINLESFNTSNVWDMGSMFKCCSSLISLNLSSFNTSNVRDMGYMFYGCESLKELNIENFESYNVVTMIEFISYNPKNLINIEKPKNSKNAVAVIEFLNTTFN